MKNISRLISSFGIIILTLLVPRAGHTGTDDVPYSVLTKQPQSVLCLTFSPGNSNTLAIGQSDGTIQVWDTSTRTLQHTLDDHTKSIFNLVFSPDGRTLASGSLDNTVRLWDTGTGNLRRTLTKHTDFVFGLAFSADGSILASGSKDGTIRLWNPNTGQQLNALTGYVVPVISLAFSPTGKVLGTGRADTAIRLWNLSTGRLQSTLRGHTDLVLSLAFNADGSRLASGGADGTLRLWNTSTGRLQRTLTAHTDWVNSVAFNETTLASGSFDKTIRLWDADTGNLQHTLTAHKGSVESLAFNADGSVLASGDVNGSVLLWELTPVCPPPSSVESGGIGAPLLSLSTSQSSGGAIVDVVFSSDGGTVYSAATSWQENSTTILLQDAVTGDSLETFKLEGALYNYNYDQEDHWQFVFNDKGATIAAGIFDGKVKLWRKNNPLKTLQGNTQQVQVIAISADGRVVAGSSKVYKTGKTHSEDLYVWNTVENSLKTVKLTPAVSINCLAFSPDGHILAIDNGKSTIRLWDWEKDVNLKVLNNVVGPTTMAFSPKGRTLASGTNDGRIQLWDWETDNENPTILFGHWGSITDLVFSPDGHILASGSTDNTVQLWDTTTGKRLKILMGHTDSVNSLTFSPIDTDILASRSENGEMFLWNANCSVPPQQEEQQGLVRLVYFIPKDRIADATEDRSDIQTRFDGLIKSVQHFYAEQMASHGLGRKTFTFEANQNGKAKVHVIVGDKEEADYLTKDGFTKITKEVKENLDVDVSRNAYLVAINVSVETVGTGAAGIGGGWDLEWHSYVPTWWSERRKSSGAFALIPSDGKYFSIGTTAHELGHVWGLLHDFRDSTYIMAYGSKERLSESTANWLDASRFFNPNQPDTNSKTVITELCQEKKVLKFKVEDADGLHQVQLLASAKQVLPGYHGGDAYYQANWEKLSSNNKLSLHDWKQFEGTTSATVEFTVDDVLRDLGWTQIWERLLGHNVWSHKSTAASIADPDMAWKQVIDNKVRINVIDKHGNIAFQDFNFTNITLRICSPFAAPPAYTEGIPLETSLLSNYPNPFNPETWIPYRLATSGEVTLTIYAINGQVVRTLALGHQAAGFYESRARAAHWDGRNALGEPVASGVYFYTFTAGDFTATRKMLIRK